MGGAAQWGVAVATPNSSTDEARNPMGFGRVDRSLGPTAASLWARVAAERGVDYLARCAKKVCAPSGVTVPERHAALDAMARRAVRDDVVAVPTGTAEERMQRAARAVRAALSKAGGDVRPKAAGGRGLCEDVDAAVVRAWGAQARGEAVA